MVNSVPSKSDTINQICIAPVILNVTLDFLAFGLFVFGIFSTVSIYDA